MATREEANEWLAKGGYVGLDEVSWAFDERICNAWNEDGYTLLAPKADLDAAVERAEKAEKRVAELERQLKWMAEVKVTSVSAAQLAEPVAIKTFDWDNATDEQLLAGAKVGDRVRVEYRPSSSPSRSRNNETTGSLYDSYTTPRKITFGPGWYMRDADNAPQYRVVEILERAEPQTLTAAEAEAYLRGCSWRRVVDDQGRVWRHAGVEPVWSKNGQWYSTTCSGFDDCTFTIAPDEPPPWREVSAEDALRERRLHPDDEWEWVEHDGCGEWLGERAVVGFVYRHRPRRKGGA